MLVKSTEQYIICGLFNTVNASDPELSILDMSVGVVEELLVC